MPRVPSSHAAFLFALLVVAGGAAPAVVSAQSDSGQVYGKPSISIQTSTYEFEPGRSSTLELSLTNRGRLDQGGPSEYETLVTTAEGLTLTVLSGSSPIEINTGTVAVGDVATGTTDVPAIRITVPEDTPPGRYRLPVEFEYHHVRLVSYDSSGAEFSDLIREERGSVTIRVRDQARFEVVDVETTAKVGDTGTLDVTLRNVGTDPARDASVKASTTSDELTFGTGSASSTAFVGAWGVDETRTVSYKVGFGAEAVLRDYTANLVVDYTDRDGINQTSRTLKVGVRPVEEQSFDLQEVSSSLRVGEEGMLAGTVVNEGPGAVTNPVVTIRANNPNVEVNSPEYALPDLESGESAPFDFSIEVSSGAEASVQQFGLTLEYENEDGDTRTSDPLKATARIDPKRDRFNVELAEEIESITAGGQRAIRIEVTNNGDVPLTDVEAKAFVSSPLSSDDDEAIISSLNPGESSEIVIGVGAAGTALEKAYPVTIDFQYTMPDGETQLSRTYTVPIEVRTPNEGSLPIGGVVVVLGLLGALGFVGWRRRESVGRSVAGARRRVSDLLGRSRQ